MRRPTVWAFIAATLMALATAVPVGATGGAPEPDEFPYGVGSNDAGPHSISLWTQTTAGTLTAEYSTDPAFAIVQKRTVTVDPSHDGTVMVPVLGLSPATTYYYKFVDPATKAASRVGAFRTAPDPSADVDVLFALSGDQDGTIDSSTGQPCFNDFETFAAARAEDPDFYVNLGDTIYSDSRCLPEPNTTLQEYRDNYKQGLSYQNLRDLRAATSFYTQWDDHEVRNDFDVQTVDPALLANGRQAFIEYDGMRPPDPNVGFYRRFRWGREAEIFVLDERSFRTAEANRMDADHDGVEDCQNPVTGRPDLAPTLNDYWRGVFGAALPGSGLDQLVPLQCRKDLRAKGRTMLGAAQRSRFLTDLAGSTARFKLVINEDAIQQVFALPYDRWEGFRWERQQVLRFIDEKDIQNVLWLTTDVHGYLAHTVDYNTSDPGVGQQVEGMYDYTFGPVATDDFGREIDRLAGPGAADLVQQFLLNVNLNSCANLGGDETLDPTAPYYGYGFVFIDAGLRRIAVRPKDYMGRFIAGNGGTSAGGLDDRCYDYISVAR